MDEKLTIQGIIDDETVKLIDQIDDLEFGSENYKRAIQGIDTLRKLSLEDAKLDLDWDERAHDLDLRYKELELKERELDQADENAKKDRWIKISLGIGSILVPAVMYNSWNKRGFKFEESGHFITSSTMKNISNSCSSWMRKFF